MPEMEPAVPGEQESRVFTDAAGRNWRVTFSQADDEGALEFTCLGESREQHRVMAVSPGFSLVGVDDETLRAWLQNAPRLGRLTE